MTEEEIYLYHVGCDFLAKCSLQSKDAIQRIRERFKIEAAKSDGDDSTALRILANSIEPYIQD